MEMATGDSPAPRVVACLELNSIEAYDPESLRYYESDQSENSDLGTYLNLESLPVQLNAMSIRDQESIEPKVKICLRCGGRSDINSRLTHICQTYCAACMEWVSKNRHF